MWRWVICASALLLTGCDDRFPDYRYKMTIHVGDKAFSSVRQIRVEEVSSTVDSSGAREKISVAGEAVILELPGRTIYALLNKPDDPDYAEYMPALALAPHIPDEAPPTEVQEELRAQREKKPSSRAYLDDAAERLRKMVRIEGAKDLPRNRPNPDPYRGPRMIEQWPMFVAFSDPNDPKTVYEVAPSEIGANRITVEITGENITSGIANRLVWLDDYRSKMLDGQRLNDGSSLANNLSVDSFQQGDR